MTFHGYVDYGAALIQLYQRATALVVPSLSGEGFPQVINEALCIGIPTIASKVGGVPHFLTHGLNALLVPPADTPALIQAIERTLADAALRDRLRRNGQELMKQHTLEANRDHMIQIIRDEVMPAEVGA